MLIVIHGCSKQNIFLIAQKLHLQLHANSDVFVPHHPRWPRDWLIGRQVTPPSPLRCTTWTPTSWTPTPWPWRLWGRSFRTTTATRCSPLWALEPNCPLMDGCRMSFHWWSQPLFLSHLINQFNGFLSRLFSCFLYPTSKVTPLNFLCFV